MALGTNFACALDEDGRVFAWGCNRSGELGVGDLEWRTEPTEVSALFGKVVKSLQCGGQHVIALGSGEQPVAPPAQARSKSREAATKPRRRAGGRETSPLREKGATKHSKSAKGLRTGGEGAERVRLIEAEDELMHKNSQLEMVERGPGGIQDLRYLLEQAKAENEALTQRIAEESRAR